VPRESQTRVLRCLKACTKGPFEGVHWSAVAPCGALDNQGQLMRRAIRKPSLKRVRAPECFPSEASLVSSFVDQLSSGTTPFGVVEIATEWNHRAGLVDLLLRDSSFGIVALEAKLYDWKRAFLQAYRSTAYANRTYLLLPSRAALRALQEREEFEFRGVGLCSFDGGQCQILIEAVEQEALLSWVRQRAHDYFDRPSPSERAA